MVDEVKGVGQPKPQQEHSSNGMKLSDLQKTNQKLYEYFKKQNLSDDSYVFSSDIEKLKALIDKNQNSKITVKEMRKAGFEGSRKEIKALRESLNTVQNNEIKDNKPVPVKIDDNTTDFYSGDQRVRTVVKDGKTETITNYTNDGKTPKDVLETTTDKDNNAVVSHTHYHEGKKNYTELTSQGEKATIIYNPADDSKVKRAVRQPIDENDKESIQTVEHEYDADGNDTITAEYEGKYVKDGVTRRVVKLDNEGKVISNKTNLDIAKEEAEKKKAEFQKFNVPKGWSVSDIARAYGISREEVLNANVDGEGHKAYRTNKKGVEYFLIDQEINIPGGAEFNKEYKPKVRVVKPAAEHKGAEKAEDAAKTKGADKTKGSDKTDKGKAAEKTEAKPIEEAKTQNLPGRDMRPPKQDATATIYAFGMMGHGMKNTTMTDFKGNKYTYDDKGRLSAFKNVSDGTEYMYYYDQNNKLKAIYEFGHKDIGTIRRKPDGTVIAYVDRQGTYRYGNGIAMNNQSDGAFVEAKLEDFNPPDFMTRIKKSSK